MATTFKEYMDMERSLTLEEMQDIHRQMLTGIGSDEDAKEIYGELVASATKYAAIRAEWLQLGREERAERDSRRTSCHDSLIVKFNMLARYLKAQGKEIGWRDCLGYEEDSPYNRKRIGDFACYIVFVNSLNAR